MNLPIGYEERKNKNLRELGIADPENYDIMPNGVVRRRAAEAAMAPEPEKMSALQAGARGFVGALPETAGGILGAAGAGALAGTLGAGPVGTILGGLAGAFVGSYAGGKAEEAIAPQSYIDWQREAEEQRPLASAVGSLAAQVPFMWPGIQPLRQASRMLRTGMRATAPQIESALNVGIGASVGGAGSVASDLVAGREIDWQRAALETGAGALLNTPTRLTTRMTLGRFRPDTFEPLPEDYLKAASDAEYSTTGTETAPGRERTFDKSIISALNNLGFRNKYKLESDDDIAGFLDRVLKTVQTPEKKVQGQRTKLDRDIRTIEDNLALMDDASRVAAEAELAQLKNDRAFLDDAFKLRGLVDEYKAMTAKGRPALPEPSTEIEVRQRLAQEPPENDLPPERRLLNAPPEEASTTAPGVVDATAAAVARANQRAAEIAQATEQQRIARGVEQALGPEAYMRNIAGDLRRPEQSPEGYRANMRVGKSNAAAAAESAADLEARRIEADLAGESRPRYQTAEPDKPGFITEAEAAAAQAYGREKMGTKVRMRPKVTTRGPEPIEVRGRNVGRPTPVDLALADVSAARGTGDTPYHELLHQLIRDVRASGDARENKLVDTMLRGAGDEEALVQAAGEDFYRRMVNKKSSSFLRDFSDMIRTRFGSRDPGVAARQLSAGMRYGRGAAERGFGPEGRAVKAPPMKAVETEEKTQPLEGDAFEFAPAREFAAERPFGLTIANDGTLPTQNLMAKLDKSLNRGDRELLKFAGLEDFIGGRERVPVAELRQWIEENKPRVEVKELSAVDPKQSSKTAQLQQQIAELEHELDTIEPSWRELDESEMSPRVRTLFRRHTQLDERIMGREDANFGEGPIANDSATRRFQRVNPRELKDMPGAVDLLVKVPIKDKPTGGLEGWTSPGADAMYRSYHYPDSGDNLLTHVRAYEHELPDGRRVLRVFELQSDWAQARRSQEEFIKNALNTFDKSAKARLIDDLDRPGKKVWVVYPKGDEKFVYTKATNEEGALAEARANIKTEKSSSLISTQTANHPLLEHTNRLGLKAAIEHARKRGLDGVVIDDADTVMMTEGHDRVRTRTMLPEAVEDTWQSSVKSMYGDDWRSGKYVLFRDYIYRVDKPEANKSERDIQIARELAPYWGTDKQYIPQRGGMELNYNKLLPAALADMTGATPQRVELGTHRSKADGVEPDAPIRNADGTPKTESTGLLFPLGKAGERRAAGEPFTLTGARYQPLDPQTQTENFKNWFGDSKVVNPDGTPLRVYHGTKTPGFDTFRTKGSTGYTYGPGAYFTPEPARASVYAGAREEVIDYDADGNAVYGYSGEGKAQSAVYPVYLSIKKPFVTYSDAGVTDLAAKLQNEQPKLYDEIAKEVADTFDYHGTYGVGLNEVGNFYLRRQGYDGVIKQRHNGELIELVAFEPTQIKSAIANKGTFDPNDPRIQYQPLGPGEHGLNPNTRRLSRNIFASAVDNLRAAGTPEAKYTADGLQKLYNTERAYRGRYETPIAEALAPLNDKQKRTLLEELYNERDGARLAGPTRAAFAAIRKTLKQIAEDQIAAGQRVETPNGQFRTRGVDPKYFPNVINHDALRILTENVGSDAYNKLRKDFIDYNTARGVKGAEAIFNRLSSALNKSQRPKRGGIEFNALRAIESSKLPPSWMETDLDLLMRRYVNRTAKDRAYFDVIEKDEALSAHIGEDMYMQDKPVDKTKYKPIGGISEVRQLLDSYRGESARDDQFIRSFGRLINAAILSGPKTRLTDLATTPIKALAYAPSGERLNVLTKGVSDLINNWGGVRGAAMRTGFIRPGDQIVRTEVLGMGERAARGMDKAAENIVKYTGAEAIERGSRVVAQALGEAIGVAWRQRALRGDSRAMKFMDKLGSDWRTVSDAELGTRVGQLFQGRYDAVNLPRWAIDSDVAPFLAMARWNIEQFNNFKKFALDTLLKDKDPSMLIAQVVAGVAGGLGISELRDYITGREGYTATFKEIAEAPDKRRAAEELVSKLAEAAAVTGTVGIMGELMKQAYDVYQKKLPQGFRYPALSVATDVFQKASSMADAIIEGEDPLAVALQGGHDILFQNVQALRFLEEQSARLGGPGAEERERKIGRRDYQMFTRLGGYDVKAPPIGVPAYRGLSEREFDRETDPARAAEIAQTLVQRAISRADGDPSKLMAELRKLRTSQITFAPSLRNDPVRFMKYADFVERTRGPEAKEKLLAEYQQAAALREFKSAIVPR